jgi:alkylation response protein AidB-like acyl-CoA dehydrogenase
MNIQDLNDTELNFLAAVAEFCRSEIAPFTAQWDEDEEIPRDLFRKAAGIGLLGLNAPAQYGGRGMRQVAYVHVIQQLAQFDASFAMRIAVHNTLIVGHILAEGTAPQKQRYLPPLIRGDYLGAWALTEPEAGSDSAGLRTVALETEDGWEISGEKTFITGGLSADVFVLMACSGKSADGKKEVSAFIVPRPNVSSVEPIETYGMRASGVAEIRFEDSQGEILGTRGQGRARALGLLNRGRIGIAALATGIARGALDMAGRYSLSRTQFGQPIAQFQAIQWMLADSAVEIEAGHMLTLRAAAMQDAGVDTQQESAMAKLFTSETATRICNRCMQIHGGRGYTRELPVERFLRDVRLCEIAEGTSEIQRLVIARSLLRAFKEEVAAQPVSAEPQPVSFREAVMDGAVPVARRFQSAPALLGT